MALVMKNSDNDASLIMLQMYVQLRQSEGSGMINLSEMTMHQLLYKEFAVWTVSKGSLSKNEWCVRETAPPYERTRLRIVHLKLKRWHSKKSIATRMGNPPVVAAAFLYSRERTEP